jgi:DNA repair protein RadC
MQYAKVEILIPVVQEEAIGKAISNASDIHNECKDIQNLAQETFGVITCDQKNKIINRHIVSVGSLTESLVHPREVFRRAILDNAASVAFFHNHPSGDATPSRADKQITARLVECAALLGIRILDHVIIGKDKYHSFAENGSL